MVSIVSVLAIILCLLSITTIFYALLVVRDVLNDNRYTFVRNELILIVLFGVCLFIKGILFYKVP
jgi:hypothetical protein